MHNVRIIAGSYGGRILDTPKTKRTHPMGERIRNALFNSIADYLAEAKVLDAFAGTGALGIEALSRGARELTLIEKDRIAQKVIQNNIELLDIESQSNLVRAGVGSWLSTVRDVNFDVILVDPPYHDIKKYQSNITQLLELLAPGGILVLSKPAREQLDIKLPNGVSFIDKRNYSEADLLLYKRQAN